VLDRAKKSGNEDVQMASNKRVGDDLVGAPEKIQRADDVGQGLSGDASAAKEIVDVKASRNRAMQAAQKGLGKDIAKALAGIEQCSAVLAEGVVVKNKEFFATAEERCVVLSFLLGKEPKANAEGKAIWNEPVVDFVFEDLMTTNPKEIQEGEKTVVLVSQSEIHRRLWHTLSLRDTLKKMTLLPVEKPDAMEGVFDMQHRAAEIGTLTSVAAVESATEALEMQKRLLGQLVQSVSTAKKDLMRENKSYHAEHSKQKALEEQKTKDFELRFRTRSNL